MYKIYKFELKVIGEQTIKVPTVFNQSTDILSVQVQHGVLYVWIQVFMANNNPEDQIEKEIKFYIYGTGHSIPNYNSMKYLQSVQQGGFVWHVFTDLD